MLRPPAVLAARQLAPLAACADLLADPAGGAAPLAIAIVPSPALQIAPADTFAQVDEVKLRITRADSSTVEVTFAATPSQGEIHRTVRVATKRAEETVQLYVELRGQGVALFYGSSAVQLIRGSTTVADVVVYPIPPDPG